MSMFFYSSFQILNSNDLLNRDDVYITNTSYQSLYDVYIL